MKNTNSDTPVLLGIERDEDGCLSVWCQYCQKFHHHRQGVGHAVAHCLNKDSPYKNKISEVIR